MDISQTGDNLAQAAFDDTLSTTDNFMGLPGRTLCKVTGLARLSEQDENFVGADELPWEIETGTDGNEA